MSVKAQIKYCVQVIEKIDYPLGIIAYEERGEIIIKVKYAGELIEYEKIKTKLYMS